jgi:hypothetical protein
MSKAGIDEWTLQQMIDFLIANDAIKQEQYSKKIRKPVGGVRLDGRKIRATSLLLTLFPEFDDDIEQLGQWCQKHALFTVGGIEQCPTTGRTHVHAVLEVSDCEDYKWLKHLFPRINIQVGIRKKKEAELYVRKENRIAWEHQRTGYFRAHVEQKRDEREEKRREAKEKFEDIITLAEDGNLQQIKNKYPMEYLRMFTTLHKIATDAKLTKSAELPNRQVQLHQKNKFIYGDAGTGKTWMARDMCGPKPYLKGQNKWWDGWDGTHTGILFNDLVKNPAFNWQTVLDAGDCYPVHVEVKNGSALVYAADIPVICTSNFSPEELMEDWADSRKQAFWRRFSVIEVRWQWMGTPAQSLRWRYDPQQEWRPNLGADWWFKKKPQENEEELSFAEKEKRGLVPQEDEEEIPEEQPNEQEEEQVKRWREAWHRGQE